MPVNFRWIIISKQWSKDALENAMFDTEFVSWLKQPMMEGAERERKETAKDDRVDYKKVSESGRLMETHRNVKYTNKEGVEQRTVISETFTNMTKRKVSNTENNVTAKRTSWG